jgi:uncharacterized membrane protein YgdD (TMEM256/DUF423 family)
MHRNFLLAGIIFAGTAVAIGAFGAHGLQKLTTDSKIIEAFKTGVQYQFWHALALLLVGILYERFNGSLTKWAGWSFISGILLFSGSLYLLSFLKLNEHSLAKAIGPVTPFGGLLLILGWIFLLLSVLKRR